MKGKMTGFGWLPDISDVFSRFPVAALVAVLFTTALCTMIIIGGDDTGIFTDIAITGSAAYLGACIGHLFSESRALGRATNIVMAALAALLAAVLMYFYVALQTSELFLLGGLWLLLMVSPYLYRGARPGALWQFNFKLFLAFLLSTIVMSVFGGGLSAIIAALNILFDVDLGSKPYQLIWTVAFYGIGPLYGLALLPKSLTEEFELNDHKDTLLERAQSVLVNYVTVPLVVVYALILHAYAIKILASGTLPKGQIATIVSLFAITGTATWLLSWPWRDKGTWLLRQFLRGWFWLLPVPVVLLVVGLWRRVSDYGMSPDRYAVALVAVWAAIIFLYLLLRRNRADMRVLIGSAAVLLLLTSFGPLGAYGWTARDQTARLVAILEKMGEFREGKFVKKITQPASTPSGDAYSIVTMLGEVRALQPLMSWSGVVAEPDKTMKRWYNYSLVSEINDKLGISYAQQQAVLTINSNGPVTHVVAAGSKIVGPVNLRTSPDTAAAATQGASLTLVKEVVRLESGNLSFEMPLVELVKKLEPFNNPNYSARPVFALDLDQHFTLLVLDAGGEMGDKPKLWSLTVWVVVKE